MKYRHITLDELDQESPPQLFQMFTLSAPLKSYSELKIFRKKCVFYVVVMSSQKLDIEGQINYNPQLV